MRNEKDEIERLKRLRQQQISARDPTAKDKAYYGMVSRRARPGKLTLGGVLKDFESKWTWMFAGGIIGLILAVLIVVAVKASWAPLAAGAVIFAGFAIGRLLGAVMDWRNDDWERK
jgi:hypothetical protein